RRRRSRAHTAWFRRTPSSEIVQFEVRRKGRRENPEKGMLDREGRLGGARVVSHEDSSFCVYPEESLTMIPRQKKERRSSTLGKTRTARYIPVQQLTGTRTSRYRAVALKSAVDGRFRPSAVDFGRLRSI
ncbi:hypothetical protein B296_00053895, partial [Ensete ventricosum]